MIMILQFMSLIETRIFDSDILKTMTEQVLVTFPISGFGYMPIVMASDVWQEIYEAYQDQTTITMDDDNGETIEIDLCESVQSARVTTNPSDDLIVWASSLDTQFFMDHVCLEHDLNSWGLKLELNNKVAALFNAKGVMVDNALAIALGTVQLRCDFGGEIIITLKYVDKKKHCVVSHEASDDLVFGDDYLEKLKAYLDDVEVDIAKPQEVPVAIAVDVDLSAFDNIPPPEDTN